MENDPDNHSELTPCQRELATHSFERGIASEFPRLQNGFPSIRWRGIGQNLFCECSHLPIWMMCRILISSDEVEQIVTRRLDRLDPQRLLPFTILTFFSSIFPLMSPEPLIYTQSQNNHNVIAEVFAYRVNDRTQRNIDRVRTWPELGRFDKASLLKRSKSAQSMFHYPTKRIGLSLCTDGSPDAECPITRMEFQPGQVVYILKADESKILEGKSVACISAEGLMCLSRTPASKLHGGFIDPLKRVDHRVNIRDNYVPYSVYNDSSTEARNVLPNDNQSLAGPSSSADVTTAADAASSPSTSEESTHSQYDPDRKPYMIEVAQTNPLTFNILFTFVIFLIFILTFTLISSLLLEHYHFADETLMKLLV